MYLQTSPNENLETFLISKLSLDDNLKSNDKNMCNIIIINTL